MCGSCVEDMEEADWMVWRDCLQGVGRLSGGVGRLFGGCGKAFWRVWAEAIWKMWGGFLEGVRRLSGESGVV